MVSAFCSNQVIDASVDIKESKTLAFFREYTFTITMFHAMSIEVYQFSLYCIYWSKR